MLVKFTHDSAYALWLMCCNPGVQFNREDWYRSDDPVGEIEQAKLQRFCLNKISKKVKKMIPSRVIRGGAMIDEEKETELTEFIPGTYSLSGSLVSRALHTLKHYRPIKKLVNPAQGLLPMHFAELEVALTGKDPVAELDQYGDANDREPGPDPEPAA